jgi:hypothetical protein
VIRGRLEWIARALAALLFQLVSDQFRNGFDPAKSSVQRVSALYERFP